MLLTSHPATLISKARLAIGMSLSLLILTACSGEATPQPGASVSARQNTGILETSRGAYKFRPTVCGVHIEDGVSDIEIQGPGAAPDGEEFYFELSSTGNVITIGLGVDGPFASPERRLKAGRYASQEFTIVLTGSAISATNLALVDEHGQLVDANANLRINCN